MTWVCTSNQHMTDAADPPDIDECPGPQFLSNYMEANQVDDGRRLFYTTGDVTIDLRGVTTNTERHHHEEVYCSDCGDQAEWLEGETLTRRYVTMATHNNWLLCSHGDGRDPVILNCDACFEAHANGEPHIGLRAELIENVETWDELRNFAADQRDGARLRTPPPPPRLPATITVNGVTHDYVIGRGYIQRRPAPRTLHTIGRATDGQ